VTSPAPVDSVSTCSRTSVIGGGVELYIEPFHCPGVRWLAVSAKLKRKLWLLVSCRSLCARDNGSLRQRRHHPEHHPASSYAALRPAPELAASCQANARPWPLASAARAASVGAAPATARRVQILVNSRPKNRNLRE
jgi:hypothetical protein